MTSIDGPHHSNQDDIYIIYIGTFCGITVQVCFDFRECISCLSLRSRHQEILSERTSGHISCRERGGVWAMKDVPPYMAS